MKLFDIKTDDITDYKKISLLLVFPYCSGKCGIDCQNRQLWNKKPDLDIELCNIVEFYNSLKTHEAVVFAGLEPFDSIEIYDLIYNFIKNRKPVDIVIYTGYTDKEYLENYEKDLIEKFVVACKENLVYTSESKIIVKTGRYDKSQICNDNYSSILGVNLATKNQRAREYTYIDNKLNIHIE